jgi:homocysteine S-methyltransferase
MTPFSKLDLSAARVLDGGMATELESLGCDLSGPLWSARILRDEPEKVAAVHVSYLAAGADIILTASYQVSVEAYVDDGLSREEAERAVSADLSKSVELAEEARAGFLSRDKNRDRKILIAASLGPYGAALHNGAEYHGNYAIGFDELVAFHARRIAVIAKTNADLIAFESVPLLEEARAIVAALQLYPEIGAWISFICRDEAHTAHDEAIADCAKLLDPATQIAAVGVNCTAPEFITPLIHEIRSVTAKPVVVYPNSGEGWDAEARSWTPNPLEPVEGLNGAPYFGLLAKQWRAAGAQIIGGCCRTGPEHVRAIAASPTVRQ